MDQDTIDTMEAITDPYFKDVYVLGNWGVLGNLVFTNYVIEEFDYTENDLENVCSGMDFGFVHASAIERMGFRDGEIYVFDEIYGKGWTNAEFIAAANDWFTREVEEDGVKKRIPYRFDITADSAEPDRIKEWNQAGWFVEAAQKGPGSLGYGIDYLISKKIHIHATKCPNLAREIPMYKRREDKDGNAIEKFVELNDDTIAAARYGTEFIWSGYRPEIADFSAASLGL